jgi:hypothetical protein
MSPSLEETDLIPSTSFRDRFGKEWNVDLCLSHAYELENYDFRGSRKKVSLVNPTPEFFSKELTDVKLILGIAWIVLQDQIKEHNEQSKPIEANRSARTKEEIQNLAAQSPIADELDFTRRLDGKATAAMKVAVWGAVANFFPEMTIMLMALIGRFSHVNQKANSRLSTEIETRLSDERIDAMIDQAISDAEAESIGNTSS